MLLDLPIPSRLLVLNDTALLLCASILAQSDSDSIEAVGQPKTSASGVSERRMASETRSAIEAEAAVRPVCEGGTSRARAQYWLCRAFRQTR